MSLHFLPTKADDSSTPKEGISFRETSPLLMRLFFPYHERKRSRWIRSNVAYWKVCTMPSRMVKTARCSESSLQLVNRFAAGISLEHAAGSKTGVYVGCFTREYDAICLRDPEDASKYMSTGTSLAMLSNRLSWFYDFTGPSVAIDTACSSSLNALHLACQSVRNRESSMVSDRTVQRRCFG